MAHSLIEGIDYYIDNNGLYVFTAKYLLERNYCCGNGCRHCPYQKNEDQALKGVDNSAKDTEK